MDALAGGITEGSDAGADIERLQHAATHKNTSTTSATIATGCPS